MFDKKVIEQTSQKKKEEGHKLILIKRGNERGKRGDWAKYNHNSTSRTAVKKRENRTPRRTNLQTQSVAGNEGDGKRKGPTRLLPPKSDETEKSKRRGPSGVGQWQLEGRGAGTGETREQGSS